MKPQPQTLKIATNDVRTDIILNQAMATIELFCRKHKIAVIYAELADMTQFAVTDFSACTLVVNLGYNISSGFIQNFVLAIANIMTVAARHTKWTTLENDLRLPRPLTAVYQQVDSFYYNIATFTQRKERIYA